MAEKKAESKTDTLFRDAVNAAMKAADPLGYEVAQSRARLLPGYKKAVRAALIVAANALRYEANQRPDFDDPFVMAYEDSAAIIEKAAET